MRQVAGERPDNDANEPQHPIENWTERVPAGCARRADERQARERTHGDRPVANLFAQHQEVVGDAERADKKRVERYRTPSCKACSSRRGFASRRTQWTQPSGPNAQGPIKA